jgi:uncharacterized protein (TIGR02118 family)
MIRITVLYPNTDGAKFDMAYYTSKHMPMAKSLMPGLRSIGADLGVSAGTPGSKPTYIAIGYLIFDCVEDYQKDFAQHGGQVIADVPNYTNVRPLMQINEIKL